MSDILHNPNHLTLNLLNEVTCKQSRMGVYKLFLEFFCLAFVYIVLIQADNPDYSDDYSVQVHNYCYSCTSHVRSGNPVGPENCQDPFKTQGITEEKCEGSCAKIYEVDKYEYTRMCLPDCKEKKDEDGGYTKCCTGNLCNGGYRTQQFPLKLTIAGLVVWFILTYKN